MPHKPSSPTEQNTVRTVLVVDDEKAYRNAVADTLALTGRYAVIEAATPDEARRALREHHGIACIVQDYELRLNGRKLETGIDLLKEYTARVPHIPVVMVSGIEGRGRVAVEAIRNHAVDFIDKSFGTEELVNLVDDVCSFADTSANAQAQFAALGFITADPSMAPVCNEARIAASTDLNLLLVGETGSGKDVLAEAIHKASPRAGKPFVNVNCGELTQELARSDFYGHRRGAFTGAIGDRAGFFEEVRDGTLFLNEFTEMPRELQAVLLGAIEKQVITPLGGRRIPFNARIIAATNRDPSQAIASDRLRHDLFQRFVEIIYIPPLRERPGDVKLLAEHFVARAIQKTKAHGMTLAADATEEIARAPWPGNARQLERVMIWCVLHADGAQITRTLVADAMRVEERTHVSQVRDPIAPLLAGHLPDVLHAVRKRFIVEILRQTKGNRTQAAIRLGFKTKDGLKGWLERYGIDPEEFK